MSQGGFSKARLALMHRVMAGYVEDGTVAGLVTLLSRRGETVVDTIGCQDLVHRDPLRRDSIFRIASMTKPITAVAAMILVEECKLALDAPLDPYLPELATRRVLKRIDGPIEETEAAARPLTLRDLLTFRMGMGFLMTPESQQYPIQKAVNAALPQGIDPTHPLGPDEWLRRLGSLPLMYQPGTRWQYHVGSDVLGVLIARVAGQPFETFLKERIFEPLGMRDTGFFVPPGKLGRFTSSYAANPSTGSLDLIDDSQGSKWSKAPAFPAGGSGLVSTIDDYCAFGRMMLNMGKLAGERILARPTIELMLTDQITPAQKAVSLFSPGFWDNRGWGLGLSVVTGRGTSGMAPGQFGWSGLFGTHWISDSVEDLVCVLMIQRMNMGPTRIHEDFGTLAYQSLDD
ncbi:MAG TPA: serine hydrolase domain-containing protein [Steroidobacteraceae bacterium]|jgi:CubicO group peptidase (beta-lactamase class C family)|nr:serine hydrolase domain-containing protein [Steroidobacteraceae bacterium]